MAGFYQELAVLHAGDATMANLWKKTAREEMNHAAQFSLLIETMSDTVSAALTAPALFRVDFSATESHNAPSK